MHITARVKERNRSSSFYAAGSRRNGDEYEYHLCRKFKQNIHHL